VQVIGGFCSVEWLWLLSLCLCSINGLFKKKFYKNIYISFLFLSFVFILVKPYKIFSSPRAVVTTATQLCRKQNGVTKEKKKKIFFYNNITWHPTQQLLCVACCFVCRCYGMTIKFKATNVSKRKIKNNRHFQICFIRKKRHKETSWGVEQAMTFRVYKHQH
jgi:hypothetical protein